MGKAIKTLIQIGIFFLILRWVGGLFFGLFSWILAPLWFMIPIGAIGLFVGALVTILGKLQGKGQEKRRRWEDDEYTSRSGLAELLSNSQIKDIETSLRDFFRTSDRLILRDNLYLRPQEGKFESLDALVLWYNGEAITTIGMLSDQDPSKCKEIFEFLSNRQGNATVGSKVTTKAVEFIMQIDEVNAGIEDAAITEGLNQTSKLLRNVHYIELENGSEEKLRKLYEYYLPIMMSILTKYKSLSHKAPLSSEFIESKEKLTSTIDMINEALSNISSNYYDVEILDMSTDVRHLQSILKKDGMVGDGLQMAKGRDLKQSIEDAEEEASRKNQELML